jgi:hypothetical protein
MREANLRPHASRTVLRGKRDLKPSYLSGQLDAFLLQILLFCHLGQLKLLYLVRSGHREFRHHLEVMRLLLPR